MDSHTACQLVWWINAGRATLIAEQVAALSIEAAWVTPDASVAAAGRRWPGCGPHGGGYLPGRIMTVTHAIHDHVH